MSPVAKARAKAGGTSHEARTTVEERMAQGTRPVAPWREDGARHEARTTVKSGWQKAPAALWKSGPSRPASPVPN